MPATFGDVRLWRAAPLGTAGDGLKSDADGLERCRDTLEAQAVARAQRGRAAVSPYLLTGILPNMPAARIAIAHGIRGYASSVGTACASGAQAIADAVRLIRAGEADVVLAGASEAPLFPTFADTFAWPRAM